MNSGDAFVEIGAMYGGLQTGFGLFCLLGALRKDFYRPALTSLLLVVGGLALARLYSTATSDRSGGQLYLGLQWPMNLPLPHWLDWPCANPNANPAPRVVGALTT